MNVAHIFGANFMFDFFLFIVLFAFVCEVIAIEHYKRKIVNVSVLIESSKSIHFIRISNFYYMKSIYGKTKI